MLEGLRKAAIVAFVFAAMLAMAFYSLPNGSATKTKLDPWLAKPGAGMGIHQFWGMFSPDPPDVSLEAEGVVTYDDGSFAVLATPTGDPFTSSVWTERWRKWEELLTSVDRNGAWPDVAVFLARSAERPERTVVQVDLRRTWTKAPEPSQKADRAVQTFTFFSLDFKTGTMTCYDEQIPDTCTPATLKSFTDMGYRIGQAVEV